MIKTYIARIPRTEALQWSGDNFSEVKKFTGRRIDREGDGLLVYINDLGWEMALLDYILKERDGVLHFCDQENFHLIYEEIKDDS